MELNETIRISGIVESVKEKTNGYGPYKGVTAVPTHGPRLWFRHPADSNIHVGDWFDGHGVVSGFGDNNEIVFLKDVYAEGEQPPPQRHLYAAAIAPAQSWPQGTFTVVFKESEKHSTLRVRTVHAPGTTYDSWTFAEYLSGPDNTADYTTFAYAKSGGDMVLKRGFTADSFAVRALVGLLEADETKRHEMGVTWAKQSGNCYRCGKKLTTPESIEAGIGPVCIGLI